MQRTILVAAAALMFTAAAPAAFAASGSSGLADSAASNGTVAVTGGSMRNPGNVWVPTARQAAPAVPGQGGYFGQNPSAQTTTR
jgi:hypothetical protein